MCLGGFDSVHNIRSCHIAAQTLTTDETLGELLLLSYPAFAETVAVAFGHHRKVVDAGHLTYRGSGFIASAWREVECYLGSSGYLLSVDGVASFSIDSQGTVINLLSAVPGTTADVLVQTILGPVLILALALRDTWCLHASAVTFEHGAVAFLGESGQGKSTLASYLGSENSSTWQLLADDILPVALSPGGLDALARYPQLKLPPDRQPAAFARERTPLRAIYLLDPAKTGHGPVTTHALPVRAAALMLVRHTVAARLFDDHLQAKHLAFCADAAAQVPVRRLVYPHRYDRLPQVYATIAADLRHLFG